MNDLAKLRNRMTTINAILDKIEIGDAIPVFDFDGRATDKSGSAVTEEDMADWIDEGHEIAVIERAGVRSSALS